MTASGRPITRREDEAETAVMEPADIAPASLRRPRRRMDLPIFGAKAVARETEATAKSRREEQARIMRVLRDVARDGGLRPVLQIQRAALQRLGRDLCQAFPNFGAAIDVLLPELALQGLRRPEDFRMTPLLLHGAPGIGKTTFAAALAGRLKVDYEVISAGGTQGAFEIAGTSRHWSTANPGRVAALLARGRSACSVLVIDEIDKLAGDYTSRRCRPSSICSRNAAPAGFGTRAWVSCATQAAS